ncbi:GNAT family N-acetyltransferase [Paenibacillus sp. LMG 31456]|uniref:GNAT family N-acetyltransferase n=1 Tax=Paenibacillus foliorum TaxID=2654974 RepID=A0A972GT36_9BACL|nr:GNAT family N-acetyltransferase [Paenibacillus foliorum]NOU93693.1 GNAT family N-acetyltransferase [Paenibacillus foliorum]
MENHFPFPTLTTSRLLLRQMTVADATDLYEIYSDPQLTQYLDWYGPSSPRHAQDLIVSWNQQFDNKQLLPWGITQHTNDHLIGTIMYMPIRGTFANKPLLPVNIGFELSRMYWNKGIMTEALEVVTRFGIEQIGAHRIQAEVAPGNTASLKILEKLGFKQEGLLKQYFMHEVTKTFFDVIVLSLLPL